MPLRSGRSLSMRSKRVTDYPPSEVMTFYGSGVISPKDTGSWAYFRNSSVPNKYGSLDRWTLRLDNFIYLSLIKENHFCSFIDLNFQERCQTLTILIDVVESFSLAKRCKKE